MSSSGTLPVRRAIAALTVVAFSIAALLGVVALIGGGTFGSDETRILLTTVQIGVVSIAVLCYLATAGTPYQPVGVCGGLAVLVPLATGLLLIWSSTDAGSDEGLWKAFGVGAIVAATLAQACLLLVLAKGEAPGVQVTLGLTLLVAGLLALALVMIVLGASIGDPEVRAIGVVGILDVLGTVVVAALSKIDPDDERGIRVTLPERLRLELDGLAADTGRSRSEVVTRAVEEYLTSHVQKDHTR